MKFFHRGILGAVLAATLAACGGGGNPADTATSTPMASTGSAIHSVDSSVSAVHVAATDRKAYALDYTPPEGGSAGCGTQQNIYTNEYWMEVDGVQRKYVLFVPSTYDSTKPYKVIFAFHPRWGDAWDVAINGFFGMQQQYGDNAIYVSPQGLVDSDPNLPDATGWKNTDGRDIHFVRSILDTVKQGLCVDTQHVYAVGFSYGGMMSNAIGCEMGDVFRGISVAAGALKSGCNTSTYKVAAIAFHAEDDNVNLISEGEAARDIFLSRNNCSVQNVITVGNNGCQLYLGCDSGKNVVWCPRATGGHSVPSYFAEETKTMFDNNQ
ncbi:MAG TPA: prolyl oligopeptidase family serine peptidase [Burkholderiaceae bacterium]|nr:prolyl oligopeptidase family serine peptidase [Burkholderiaceae bacterium]